MLTHLYTEPNEDVRDHSLTEHLQSKLDADDALSQHNGT